MISWTRPRASGSSTKQILSLLKSIDARLGRIEKQGQKLGGGQTQFQNTPSSSSTQTPVIQGSWKFKYPSSFKSSSKYGKVSEEGLVLTGELYFDRSHPVGLYSSYHSKHDYYFSNLAPQWVTNYPSGSSRNLLPQLVFNDMKELNLNSGIYSLTTQYNASEGNTTQDAAIIIGEIEFHSSGYAIAEGADWDRLLNNQRQTQRQYFRGVREVATWQSHKISSSWEDGDELKFKIDTNENTIVFQKGNTPTKTFKNVLAFTNNPKYPEHLRAFAYCGWTKSTEDDGVKLTIIP